MPHPSYHDSTIPHLTFSTRSRQNLLSSATNRFLLSSCLFTSLSLSASSSLVFHTGIANRKMRITSHDILVLLILNIGLELPLTHLDSFTSDFLIGTKSSISAPLSSLKSAASSWDFSTSSLIPCIHSLWKMAHRRPTVLLVALARVLVYPSTSRALTGLGQFFPVVPTIRSQPPCVLTPGQ